MDRVLFGVGFRQRFIALRGTPLLDRKLLEVCIPAHHHIVSLTGERHLNAVVWRGRNRNTRVRGEREHYRNRSR